MQRLSSPESSVGECLGYAVPRVGPSPPGTPEQAALFSIPPARDEWMEGVSNADRYRKAILMRTLW